jgi:hypothetical protein
VDSRLSLREQTVVFLYLISQGRHFLGDRASKVRRLKNTLIPIGKLFSGSTFVAAMKFIDSLPICGAPPWAEFFGKEFVKGLTGTTLNN